MSPRHHFADYQKRDPKGYQTFSDNMWNGFVSITHTIGLGKFFSFTPDFSHPADLDGEAVGKALGEIYNKKNDYEEAENSPESIDEFWRDLGRP
jgi:hypothetical protein